MTNHVTISSINDIFCGISNNFLEMQNENNYNVGISKLYLMYFWVPLRAYLFVRLKTAR